MSKAESKKLLKDERVVNEINRHKWLESEKAGHDIGFEKAAEDWVNRFSQSWLRDNGNAQEEKKASRTFRLRK